MKVRFTPPAERQFLNAVGYILAERPSPARRLYSRAKKILKRLARFPNSGRHIPEFPELPHREVIIPPYRFFCRVRGKTLWVVAVWHGAQLPSQPSEPEGA